MKKLISILAIGIALWLGGCVAETPLPENTRTPAASETGTAVPATPEIITTLQLTATLPVVEKKEVREAFFLERKVIQSLGSGYFILYFGERYPETYVVSMDGKTDLKIANRILHSVSYDGKLSLVCPEDTCEIVDLFSDFAVWPLPADINYHNFSSISISTNLKWIAAVKSMTPNIFTIRAFEDGKVIANMTEILGLAVDDNITPIWSPDSKWLAFLRHVQTEATNYPQNTGLHLMDSACLKEPQTCPSKTYGPYRSKGVLVPDINYNWSPDSQRLVAINENEDDKLSIFDLSARSFVDLTPPVPGFVANVFWMPDGHTLIFDTDYDHFSFYLMTETGGGITQVKNHANRISGYLSTYPSPEFSRGNILTISGAGANLRLRSSAGFNGELLKYLQPGDQVELIDGPVDKEDAKWWKVKQVGSGVTGYCMENKDWYIQDH